jgi:5-methyltetrahydropteroyltriglutamate--homocysteine methyltransferase
VSKILTTHVGSLVRPLELVAYARAKRDGVAVDEAAHDCRLAELVSDVVLQQADVGIDIVSDGEFGKDSTWWTYVRERLGGFEEREWPGGVPNEPERLGRDRQEFADFYSEYNRQSMPEHPRSAEWVCVAPIHYTGQEAVAADAERLKQAVAGARVQAAFLPVVAPASIVPVRRDEYYATEEEFVFAMADALNQEYRAIVDAGLMVQVDDAFLATMYDSLVPPGTMRDYLDWAELRIEALNRALEGIPEERSRYHVCWGSWNGPHLYDIELKDLVPLILRVRAGHYALEQGNPRHEHEWRVWEDIELPEGRKLIPGVVTHSTNVVEHPELICQRIVRLAKLVGPERVIAGTDCGFAQSPFIRRVHPDVQWAKLRALVEGARLATVELFGDRALATAVDEQHS